MSRLPLTILSAAAVAAIALPAAGAAAGSASRDRDHDRMPDRWEKKHHLKVASNDASRDRDRDGLRNLAEYKAGLNPRDADSDDDGLKDGAEDAGTIVSFADGVLTIKTFGGETLTGRVTDGTEIECESDGSSALRASDDDEGEGHDDDEGKDRDGHESPSTGTTRPVGSSDDDHDKDEGDDKDESCGTAALVAGARVEEAQLAITSSGRVWREIEIEK